MANLDTLLIDGYYVRYAKVDQIQSIQLELVQDLLKTNKGKIINLEPKEYYAKVKFPMTFESKLRHNTPRPINKKIKLTQFPLNIAHARPVHKLQDVSVKNIIISSWEYDGNWIYYMLFFQDVELWKVYF